VDDAYPWLVLAPVFGLASFVLLHWLLAWWTGGARAYGCVLRAFVAAFVVTLAASLTALAYMDVDWSDGLAYLLLGLVTFLALGFGYVNFVGLSIASLRIRVLQELLASPQGLTREELLERYNPRVLIGNRIARLTTGGQLVLQGGKYVGGRSGVLWIARIIRMTRFIVLGRKRR
jgi:hypothetical protein